MENAGKIYQAIPAAMADIDAIEKDRRNQTQGFNFRGIDDVYNALHSVLAKHKIFTVPKVLSHESSIVPTKSGGALNYEKLVIEYTFFADDGSSLVAHVYGIGSDSGDKAGNKAMAIAHKYALLQVFCVPTVDEKDPDQQSHEVAAPAAAPTAPKPAPRPTAPKAPQAPEDIKTVTSYVSEITTKTGTQKSGKPWTLTSAMVGEVNIGTFDTSLGESLALASGSLATAEYKINSRGNAELVSIHLSADQPAPAQADDSTMPL